MSKFEKQSERQNLENYSVMMGTWHWYRKIGDVKPWESYKEQDSPGKGTPRKYLKERLEAADLKIDLFGESLTLFNKLKSQLSILFHSKGFSRYYIFMESVKPKDFQWQIYTIRKVLFDMKLDGECYRLLQAMLHI